MLATVKAAGLDPTATLVGATRTVIFTIVFQAGQLVQFEADDGGPDGVGWAGTYTVPDDHTIVARDSSSSIVIVYHFTLVGPSCQPRRPLRLPPPQPRFGRPS